jgi:hypothetical protein
MEFNEKVCVLQINYIRKRKICKELKRVDFTLLFFKQKAYLYKKAERR